MARSMLVPSLMPKDMEKELYSAQKARFMRDKCCVMREMVWEQRYMREVIFMWDILSIIKGLEKA